MEKAERDQCRFCLKKGHYQRDCVAYKKAQKEILDKGANSKDRGSKEKERLESGNVAGHIVDDESDDGTIYIANPTEYAMSSSASAEWTLDSGASKHFTGIQSDFTQLKRWNTPKRVRIANRSTVEATGYGTISVGGVQLREV